MNKTLVACLTAVLSLSALARAGDLVFFKASEAGEEAWGWDNAKMVREGSNLIITETDPKVSYGNVYVSDRLAYVPEGKIEVKISKVLLGKCTVQILAFQGNTHIHTADIIKGAAEPVSKQFPINAIGLPPFTETILIKIWVADAEGASTVLDELTYSMPLDSSRVLLDDNFSDVAKWTPDKTTFTPTHLGSSLTLQPGEGFGSVLYTTRFQRSEVDQLILDLAPVKNGVVTVQLACFDADDQYLESFDLLKDLNGALYAAQLVPARWPDNATQFDIKIWLAGQDGAQANLRRLMLLKPEKAPLSAP